MAIGELGLPLEHAAELVEVELNPEPDFATTRLLPTVELLVLDLVQKVQLATHKLALQLVNEYNSKSCN